MLFLRSIDALGHPLLTTRPEWKVAKLVRAAHAAALKIDDYSLVGLAARIQDAVIITAVRESCVLSAKCTTLGLSAPPTWVWNVHPDVAAQRTGSSQAFNLLVPEALPAVTRENAPLFYAPDSPPDNVIGRCVRIGPSVICGSARARGVASIVEFVSTVKFVQHSLEHGSVIGVATPAEASSSSHGTLWAHEAEQGVLRVRSVSD